MKTIFIKNMVCNRCIMAVEKVLNKLGIAYKDIKLGEIILKNELQSTEKEQLIIALDVLGFKLIDDNKSKTIEKIKNIIISLVHQQNNDLKVNISTYLSDKLNQEYSQLSSLFSEVENTTIEKYFIAQKIERVKELLVYDELTLSEIAYQLNYSSVAYLSNQFKKVTGFSPSYFKQIKTEKRIPLDKV